MSAILNVVSVPFGIIMKYIYTFIGNYGLSIITFSFLAKLLTMPLTVKQKRSAIKMQAIQPKMQEIQRKYGKDPQKCNEELQSLYAREGVSPMSGCGPTLLTLPIMMGLYYVVSEPLTYFMRITRDQIALIAETLGYATTGAGSQVGLAGEIFKHFDSVKGLAENLMCVDFSFLGINLSATPSLGEPSVLWLIPVLSALSALGMMAINQWLTKRNMPKDTPQNGQAANAVMMLVTPAMSLVFGFILPAGMGLYWIANGVFSILQDLALNVYFNRKPKAGASE